jgi:two-component system, NarL family, sensor histidine kinase BarA
MSYRTFKKLLGETSLERKCNFLFGGALMLLITGSFYFYAQLNLQIVRAQHRQRAQLLIAQNLQTTHMTQLGDPEMEPLFKELSGALKPVELREYNWKFIPQNYEATPIRRPTEKFEYDAFNRLLYRKADFVVHEDTDQGKYHYFEPVIATDHCLRCHREGGADPVVTAAEDVMGVARLTFHLEDTQKDIARNNAVLVAMAIVTACLAMLAAYAIVRYVIVKPVLHLKDVSDAIAHGDLDQRADIRTGDEFQELSHAYNRMLRHLVTTQEELRQVNWDLDAKVDELAQANLSLHEMNKIKNEFLATMSHELRTPLNSILGFSDVLAGAENLSQKQQKYVTNIRTSGQNLLMLINDILDLAKIEAGRMELDVVEFSVRDLVERLVTSMRPLAEKKNIDLQWETDPDLPILVQDAGKMQQILYNLLSNAVKFTPEGGRIRVSAWLTDRPESSVSDSPLTTEAGAERFDLVVADTGIGIPLDDQAIIFEKFRQGQNLKGQDALTREYEGTGLGLSIVKELSKLLGGEVLLESEFGKGSTFTVRLPTQLMCKTRFADEESPRSTPGELMRHAASLGAGQR